MSEQDETARIGELFERLLGDAAFRSAFRRDPAVVCRGLRLDRVARAFADDAPGVQALESRHAPSSLAGVLMAAAMEAADLVSLLHHTEHALPGPDGALARRALSRTGAIRTLERTHGEPPIAAGNQPPPGRPSLLRDHGSGQRGADAPGARPGHAAAGPHTGPVPTLASHDRRTGALPAATPAGIADAGSGMAGYPGDHASAERIAAWMAYHAERRGLPGELPVMAALVESNLRNLPNGDATSVGFFQMQTAVWLKRYPGYPDNPELQLKWFIDEALSVRAGNPELARDPSRWGEWVASVEKPLEIYRSRYAARLDDARALLHAGHVHPSPDAPMAAPGQPAAGARTGAAAAVVKSAAGNHSEGPAAPTPGARTGVVNVLDPSARTPSSLADLVHLAAGANVPGKPLQSETLGFLRRVAEQLGHAITIGTGTNHSKLTVNGNISDHYTGHAADIPVPVDSPQGDRIAASALIAAGYTPEEAWRCAHQGGLWTIPNYHGLRIQVIWKTYEGGNHHNHVHIGARPA